MPSALGAAIVTVRTIEFATGSGVHFADALSRAIQGIIAGVGFLGGGAILKSRTGEDVRGLTTAASIWVVASLGIACGGGFWIAAVVALALAIFVLAIGQHFEAIVHRFFGPVEDGGPPEHSGRGIAGPNA